MRSLKNSKKLEKVGIIKKKKLQKSNKKKPPYNNNTTMQTYKQFTFIFTLISAICTLILLFSFIHFIIVSIKKRKEDNINNLVQKIAHLSLFGYTFFVFISFILYLIQSLWYIPSINIKYNTILCQIQTFNICFFMMV